MQYQVRQIIRATEQRHTDKGQRRYISNQQVSYLPARDKEDASHLAIALDRATDQHWRENGCECARSFDVVTVCYISDGRKLVLTDDDMAMIAREYTNPHDADAADKMAAE